jgi:enoyl-CoA hydratase/carnithine racemase
MKTIRYEARDRIAYAALDRSAARNAIDEDMLADLGSTLERAGNDDVRALVLTGVGDAFCIGLDIGLLRRAFAEPAYFRDVLTRYEALLLGLEALPVPVIAAVNGLARAGGFEMILAADLAIVADEARIADHHLEFGIMPGGGATQRAPRKLGAQRARELIYTARWLTGAEAVAAGLALRSVPRAKLDAAVEELCAQLRTKSRAVLAETKRLIRDGEALPLRAALDLEIDRFMRYLEDEPTARDGFNAYIEGKK